MTDQPTIETLLEQTCPPTPTSAAPELSALEQRLALRKRRRKIRTTALAAGLTCAVSSLLWIYATPDTPTAGSRISRSINLPSTENQDIAPPAIEPTSARVRVLGKVSRPVPIYGLEPETQQLHLIGWIESEEIVPVDLSQIPTTEQANIEAVLDDSDDDRYFTL